MWSRHPRRPWQRVIASALVAAVGLLAGCGTASTVPPAPTATATPAARPTPVTGLLDPVPSNCPSQPPPTRIQWGPVDGFSQQGTVEGNGPAWLTSSLDVLHLDDLGYQPLPQTKELWAIGPDYSAPVTIQGQDTASGAPMWIQPYGYATTTKATLSGAPNRGSGSDPQGRQWDIWGTGLIFLKAGCYRITVSWPGGTWSMVAAVGR